MVLAILLYIGVFTLFLFMGMHILLINPRNRIHIIFFSISLFLAESALGGVLINYPGGHGAAQLWFKTSTALSAVLPSLFLIFAVEISGLIPKKLPLYTAVGAITLYLLVRLLTLADLVELVKIGGVWYMQDIHAVGPFFLYVAYYILATLGYFVLLLIWRKGTERVKEKREAAILLLSYFTGIAPVLIILLLNYFGIIERLIAGFGIFFYPLWYIGVFFCIVRFHFLSITPEMVSRELIECIDESIILLDGEKNIVFSNEKIGKPLINVHAGASGLEELVVEYEPLEKEIERLLAGEFSAFVCRCTYRAGGDRQVPVRAKFSLVKDTYGDVIGIMIVGNRVKEMKQLRALYRLTRREGEILEQMILGLPYTEITRGLDISRNTLKRHIANIYIKLGVNSRVELITILREYDLVPADNADRTILPVADAAEGDEAV